MRVRRLLPALSATTPSKSAVRSQRHSPFHKRLLWLLVVLLLCIYCFTWLAAITGPSKLTFNPPVQIGSRPAFLVDKMRPSSLKIKLSKCASSLTTYKVTDFSIGHRGAGLQYPEHTIEGYLTAIRQGAGIVECDVTFTKDLKLVCRHDQCDLHATTDVLLRPLLAYKCSTPFVSEQDPLCCTSDFTLEELKSLCAKMDGRVHGARTPEEYVKGTPSWRTDLFSVECPKIPTHRESIELFKSYGRKMTPELKKPRVDMPFDGHYTQEKYAQHMINEYIEAGVSPQSVFPQSMNWEDLYYWIQNSAYGNQAVALDKGTRVNFTDEKVALEYLKPLLDHGVKIYAPPIFKLLSVEEIGKQKKIIPSPIAVAAKICGLKIFAWTLERAGPLSAAHENGLLLPTTPEIAKSDGDLYEIVDILANDVGVSAIFSDWPATVTFFANCKGLSPTI